MGVTPTSPQIQQAPSNKMAEWKSGNCDCCALGCGGCLMHTCFPCALYQTGERQGGQGVMYSVISLFFPCIPIMMARNKARETHNIEGSAAEDACMALCCPVCASVQAANQEGVETY